MISILYEKEDKKLAIQISKKFQSSGYKTSLNIFENNEVEKNQPDTVILIFSKKSNLSEKLIESFDFAIDNLIPVIPFIISDVEMSITTKHFLNTHDWINAFDVNTNEAIDDLLYFITNIEAKTIPKENKITDTGKIHETKNKNQRIAIIGVATVFIIILAFLIFGNKNTSPSNLKHTPEEMLVGSWHLDNYQDNMQRSQQEYVDFLKNIEQLKLNFLLKFSNDGSFEKYGFEQVEKGNWEFDPINEFLYMWPPNAEGQKDMLHIEKLTNDTLIMSIATKVDSLTLINTKFTLYKE